MTSTDEQWLARPHQSGRDWDMKHALCGECGKQITVSCGKSKQQSGMDGVSWKDSPSFCRRCTQKNAASIMRLKMEVILGPIDEIKWLALAALLKLKP